MRKQDGGRRRTGEPVREQGPEVAPAPDPRQRRFTREFQRRIVEAARRKPIREIVEEFGVSRESVRRWKMRDRVSAARSAEDERLGHYDGYHRHWREVLRLWKERPGLGPAQIQNQLKRDGVRISISTVRNILEENGYTPPKAAVKDKRVRRFEAVRPLEMVHLDFKHFFINRFKAHLLLLQDDYSRFLCGYRLCDSEDMQSVIDAVEECINRYGKMQSIVTDAGSAFYSWNGLNRFQRLLVEEYGVDQIKATNPRTNGKIEAANKQVEKELLTRQYFGSIAEADAGVADWVRFYNFERTHLGLPKGMVPADRFLPGWNTLAGKADRGRGTGAAREPKHPIAPAGATGGLPAEPLAADRPRSASTAVWEEILRLALKKVA